MASSKQPQATPEGLSRVAEKATALVQDLQSRLNRAVPVAGLPPEPAASEPVVEDETSELDRQLQEYFRAGMDDFPNVGLGKSSILNAIRDRVIDRVVDRILESWENTRSGRENAIESAVIERLTERVLQSMETDKAKNPLSGSGPRNARGPR